LKCDLGFFNLLQSKGRQLDGQSHLAVIFKNSHHYINM